MTFEKVLPGKKTEVMSLETRHFKRKVCHPKPHVILPYRLARGANPQA